MLIASNFVKAEVAQVKLAWLQHLGHGAINIETCTTYNSSIFLGAQMQCNAQQCTLMISEILHWVQTFHSLAK